MFKGTKSLNTKKLFWLNLNRKGAEWNMENKKVRSTACALCGLEKNSYEKRV